MKKEDNSVKAASVGDIYVDEKSNAWRVLYTCAQPTVCMQRLLTDDDALTGDSEITGGIGGNMWKGFKRVYKRNLPWVK